MSANPVPVATGGTSAIGGISKYNPITASSYYQMKGVVRGGRIGIKMSASTKDRLSPLKATAQDKEPDFVIVNFEEDDIMVFDETNEPLFDEDHRPLAAS
jgi:hypothetical protein